MDTSIMEYTAEDLIAHKLERAGLLVAKPKFDQNGADLLALLDVMDGAKFCRIQCKGRSLLNSSSARVELPAKYVTDGPIVFLFVEIRSRTETHLYCFLGREIRASWARMDDDYVLNITQLKFEADLAPYLFDESRIREIKIAIINVNVIGEFETMGHGYANLTSPSLRGAASGTPSETNLSGEGSSANGA